MGIVNTTPDSFSDGGRFADAAAGVSHGLALVGQGADIIDVGGESTRPGSQRIDPAEERARAIPVVAGLAAVGVRVSIDTLNASTAVAAAEAGATIVNDVSGGRADAGMVDAVARLGVEFVIGHWRGPSADMYAGAVYDDVVEEVCAELRARASAAEEAGIHRDRIVLDPGLGFAKQGEQNWAVLRGLPRIVGLGYRVLVGASRKGFLRAVLPADATMEQRDAATAATSALAARDGVWAVRVHDVASTRTALAVADAWRGDGGG